MKNNLQNFSLQLAINNFNSVSTLFAYKNICRLRFFLFGYFFSFFVAVQKRKSNRESLSHQIDRRIAV